MHTLNITLLVSSSIISNSRKSTLYTLAESGQRNPSHASDKELLSFELSLKRL